VIREDEQSRCRRDEVQRLARRLHPLLSDREHLFRGLRLDGQLRPQVPESRIGVVDLLQGLKLFPGLVQGVRRDQVIDQTLPDRRVGQIARQGSRQIRQGLGLVALPQMILSPYGICQSRLGVLRNRLVKPCHGWQSCQLGLCVGDIPSHKLVGQDLVRMLRQHTLEFRSGLIELAQLPQGHREQAAQTGFILHRQTAGRDLLGLVRASPLHVQLHELLGRVDVARPETQHIAVGRDGLLEVPLGPRKPLQLRVAVLDQRGDILVVARDVKAKLFGGFVPLLRIERLQSPRQRLPGPLRRLPVVQRVDGESEDY